MVSGTILLRMVTWIIPNTVMVVGWALMVHGLKSTMVAIGAVTQLVGGMKIMLAGILLISGFGLMAIDIGLVPMVIGVNNKE